MLLIIRVIILLRAYSRPILACLLRVSHIGDVENIDTGR